MNRRTIACLAVLPGLAFTGATLAQMEAEPPPLRGPEVAEDRIEGVEAGFSSMTAPGRMSQPVPMPVFRRALAELSGEAAPDGARLTEEQIERLRQVQREHREAQQAFRRQHAPEFRELRQALGPALADRLDARSDRARPEQRRASQRDQRRDDPERTGRAQPRAGGEAGRGEARRGEAGDDRAPAMAPERPERPLARGDLTEEQRAAIARLRALQATAPGVEALQTRLWAELTEPQRQHVQSRIEAHRTEMTERRAAAYVERMMAQREEGDAPRGASDRPARPGAAAAVSLPPELRETLNSLPEPLRQRLGQLPAQRLERILERLSRLTPDERAQVLRRMAAERRGEPARRPDGMQVGPDRSTPPSVEDLNVPRAGGNG